MDIRKVLGRVGGASSQTFTQIMFTPLPYAHIASHPPLIKISSVQFEFPHIQKSINVGKKGLGKPRRVCAASKYLEEGGIGEGSRKGEVDWSSLSLVNALHVS